MNGKNNNSAVLPINERFTDKQKRAYENNSWDEYVENANSSEFVKVTNGEDLLLKEPVGPSLKNWPKNYKHKKRQKWRR